MDFGDFNDYCSLQSITIDQDILEVGLNPEKNRINQLCNPSGIFAAIAESGRILRERPGTELIDNLIIKNRQFRFDRVANCLLNILNNSKDPFYLENDFNFNCKEEKGIDACGLTESRFCSNLLDLINTADENRDIKVCQLIGDDLPLFFRKFNGINSSISLEDITIDGILYPSGSLFNLILDDDYDDIYKNLKNKFDGVNYENVGIEHIKSVGFVRLTTFALPIRQRKHHFAKYWEIMQKRNLPVDQFTTLEDIRYSINKLLNKESISR